jgi:hypothetical protein
MTQVDDRTLMGRAGYREDWSPFGDPDAQDPDPAVRNRFFGKYQGTVVNNLDPYQQGRLLVNVPDVHGLSVSNWAMPCVPFTSLLGGAFVRPAIGSNVWVEFEAGDPQKPIWVGGFWGKGELPPLAKVASAVPPTNSVATIETPTTGIVLTDIPLTGANVYIRSRIGAIAMGPTGIVLSAPTVVVQAASFIVNAGRISLGAPA